MRSLKNIMTVLFVVIIIAGSFFITKKYILKETNPSNEEMSVVEEFLYEIQNVFGEENEIEHIGVEKEDNNSIKTAKEEQGVDESLYYARSLLSDQEKEWYDEILSILEGFKESEELSFTDTEEVYYLFTCILNDHPEIYYVHSYEIEKILTDDVVTKIIFRPQYIMTKSESDRYMRQIGVNAGRCLSMIPQTNDEYRKFKYLYEYVVKNVTYDINAENGQTILSSLIATNSVCQGYTKAMQYLCQKEGLFCTMVTGFAKGEAHAWNLVRCNGKYYWVDVTWGESSYTSDHEGLEYTYFMINDNELMLSHSLNNIVETPVCTDTDDNYFVREGLIVTGYDEEKLSDIFALADTGAAEISFKCSDLSVFRKIEKNLIEEQKIFDYLPDVTTLDCSKDEETYIFHFWI